VNHSALSVGVIWRWVQRRWCQGLPRHAQQRTKAIVNHIAVDASVCGGSTRVGEAYLLPNRGDGKHQSHLRKTWFCLPQVSKKTCRWHRWLQTPGQQVAGLPASLTLRRGCCLCC